MFQPKGIFVCYFGNVNGLLPGAPVWMAGVEVGNVKDIEFVNLDSLRVVKVTCRARKAIWNQLTPGTVVQLGTIGFLGDKFVEIIPSLRPGEPIAEGAELPVRDAGSAERVFKQGEEALAEAGSVISNLDSLLARVNRGEGTLGKFARQDEIYIEMTRLLTNLTALTGDLQKNQERIISSLEKTSTSIGSLSEKVDQNAGTVGRLFNDPQLYDNLNNTTARLDTIMTKLNNAEGSMGLLVNDSALYIQTSNLLARLNNLVADIERNPRKYLKFSVF
jgi:phospholipid/cholesterol/gamma-HCH transport system substrate-binding protein